MFVTHAEDSAGMRHAGAGAGLFAGLLLCLCQAALLVAATPAWAEHDDRNEPVCLDLRFRIVSGVTRDPAGVFRPSEIPRNWAGVADVPVYYISGTQRDLDGSQPPRPREVTWVAGQPIAPITFTVPRTTSTGDTTPPMG